MKSKFSDIHALFLAAILCAAMVLPGCSILGKVKDAAGKPPATSAPAQASAKASTPAGPASAASGGSGWDEFAQAFTTVDENPLNEAIQYTLWLAAQNPQEETPAAGGPAGEMQTLAGKYAALVAGQGVHYVEVSDALGMKIRTEYWVKGGKFKKAELDLERVSLFDGLQYVQYETDEKTGTRYAASYAAEAPLLTKGMLSSMAASPGEKKEDAKVGSFDCSVFFYDIDIMGIKGETLYVDKETGMLVKMQMGDPESKESMATYVESLEAGGFGDEVFTVPADIALTDYAPAS